MQSVPVISSIWYLRCVLVHRTFVTYACAFQGLEPFWSPVTNFTEFARTRFKTKEIVSYSVQSNFLFLKKTVIIKDDKKRSTHFERIIFINLVVVSWSQENDAHHNNTSLKGILGLVSRKSREPFGPEKPVVKLQSVSFEKLRF